MIAIDLSEQQTFGVDPKSIQQIIFPKNLDWAGNITMLFIVKEVKESILYFGIFAKNSKSVIISFHNCKFIFN